MALKRLDEEFLLKPGTQLLPYMRRLLPSLEARFQGLEAAADYYEEVTKEIRDAALLRMNEILVPATEDIVAVSKLGFLLAPSSTSILLEVGTKYFYVDEGSQRDTFTPSPYVLVERRANIDDYAIARMLSYTQATGELVLQITAHHGNPGPHSDWVISSTPGMADSTKLYHDAIAPMHAEVSSDYDAVVILHAEILAAAQALEESGLDVQNFIRKDATVDFTGQQRGVTPAPGANDTILATTAWTRARIQEYVASAVKKTGDTMGGPLVLSGAPTQPLHAVTKAYVDAIIGTISAMTSSLSITAVNPAVVLRPTGTGQQRAIIGNAVDGSTRWYLSLADNSAESGGNSGSNFTLLRYTDGGAYIDSPFNISRNNGAAYFKALNFNQGLVGTGDFTLAGDAIVYRPGTPTTGVVYMNQGKTAYHYWDGTTHVLAGGGLSTGAVSCGALTSGALSTNGNLATVWGLTCHGAATINAGISAQGMTISSTGPTITMADTDWANMHIHHQGGNIGFLNNVGSWCWHTNPSGHIWSTAYGWMHDYVWSTSNNVANNVVNAAMAGVQTGATSIRMVHAGDHHHWWSHALTEPFNGACVTGISNELWGSGTTICRYRHVQIYVSGTWVTAYFT
jgi:signal peptidase I